ncbi:hypothetical protein ACWGB8_02075 [Kitasatospora sp. NPDC054939]
MRRQLRPFHSPAELARIYSRPYDHTHWPAHVERVAHTASVLDRFASSTGARTVADMSAGDGAVLAQSQHQWEAVYTGDLTTSGSLELTIPALPDVDMYVCSETLEHVEDPDLVLRLIRERAAHLLLTTPHGEKTDDNPEHYWGWDARGLLSMLHAAGWRDCDGGLFTPQSSDYYTFQIWTCS